MKLILSQKWPCEWVLEYYNPQSWQYEEYTDPLDSNHYATRTFTILAKSNDNDCCFIEWTNARWETVSTDAEYEFTLWKDDERLTAIFWPCEPTDSDCKPWYKDEETLLAKANCICKRYWIEAVSFDLNDNWINDTTFYVLVDLCKPWEYTFFGDEPLPYEPISIMLNPDYILPMMEYLCANEVSWTWSRPD